MEGKKVKSISHVQLFVTPWTIAYQTPPSVGFSRQEHWSGLPFPSPGDLPNPGIKPGGGDSPCSHGPCGGLTLALMWPVENLGIS